MAETLHEFVDSRGVALKVDREKGVLHGVKILGRTSKNGRAYPQETIQRALPLYEGAKVNVNHAPQANAPRGYQDRIGVIRNVRTAAEGAFGDFHFNPKHALAEQLLWDAEHAPENVGFSHNVEAKVARQKGTVVVEEILSVQSVDLVADPASTRGLFESQETSNGGSDMDLAKLTLAELREARGDLLKEVAAAAVQEHLNGEEASKAAAELARLREEVAGYKRADALAAKVAKIDALLSEAKLPKELVDDAFRKSLVEAGDDTAKALIESCKKMAAKIISGKPISREQSLTEGAVNAPADAKSFVSAIT